MVLTTTHHVDTVRDGDSFHTTSTGEIRLVDVCAPERGNPGYTLAKSRLEALILHKRVTIRAYGRDKYGRVLADVFVGNTYVNAVQRQYGYRC